MSRARILADYVSSGDELALKAPLASPAFTGTPTGITAAHLTTAAALPAAVTGGSGLDAVSPANLASGVLPVGVTGGSGLDGIPASSITAGTLIDAVKLGDASSLFTQYLTDTSVGSFNSGFQTDRGTTYDFAFQIGNIVFINLSSNNATNASSDYNNAAGFYTLTASLRPSATRYCFGGGSAHEGESHGGVKITTDGILKGHQYTTQGDTVERFTLNGFYIL